MTTKWLLGLLKNSLKRDLKGWAKVGLFAGTRFIAVQCTPFMNIYISIILGPGIAFYLHKEKTVGGFTTVIHT